MEKNASSFLRSAKTTSALEAEHVPTATCK